MVLENLANDDIRGVQQFCEPELIKSSDQVRLFRSNVQLPATKGWRAVLLVS